MSVSIAWGPFKECQCRDSPNNPILSCWIMKYTIQSKLKHKSTELVQHQSSNMLFLRSWHESLLEVPRFNFYEKNEIKGRVSKQLCWKIILQYVANNFHEESMCLLYQVLGYKIPQKSHTCTFAANLLRTRVVSTGDCFKKYIIWTEWENYVVAQ